MRTGKIAIALLVMGAWLAPASEAMGASAGPAWQLALTPVPTNFAPGRSGTTGVEGPMYRLVATNIGGGPSKGTVTLKVTLPAGLTPLKSEGDSFPSEPGPVSPACSVAGQIVTCVVEEPTYPGRWIGARIPVAVSSSLLPEQVLEATASVSGGGGATVKTVWQTEIETEAPPFDFLAGSAGLSTLFTDADGSAATVAGSHPDQLTVSLGFPLKEPVTPGPPTAAGQPRSVVTDLPRGVIANPAATPERCTEAELIGDVGCPDASQVGLFVAMTMVGDPTVIPTALYNMVPPPGMPAELATNALNASIFVHLKGSVRSDGDFGLSSRTDDIIARTLNPVMSAQAQLWGDPSGESHDEIRGACHNTHHLLCPPPTRQNTPFLTMPSACSGPLTTTVKVESWEEPGVFHERSAESTDVLGNPVGVNGCSGLKFEPTLTLRPDAQTASTPTGIHVDLKVPQNNELVKEVGGEEIPQRATSNLKDAKIVLPEGMAINPAAAAGLDACTPAQIGLRPGPGVHFSADRPACPESSRVGQVEVDTPVLDHPVHGSVYVAAPYNNPFGTLLGIYVVIDEPNDGLVVKLAGKTEADPVTGQLTTTFEEAPELPFEDFKVDLFNGPRSVLRTPSTCGSFATQSDLTPWSGTATVHKSDAFEVSGGANGRPCVSGEGSMPNDPGFEAGTVTPLAATYSPMLSRLSREDGTQQLKALSLTLPPGLTGKLAGLATCSNAAIAAASAKSGQAELAGPSCPAGSKIGEVKAGAGAGPAPYYTTGNVYLAGPYQGAPFSGVVITPAVAGPFDLGNVVIRAPAYVDPATAQVRIRSDEFPHILQGIPLQLRDARLSLDRSEFTLNPSSCAEMAISGEATALLGSIAPISQRFQVGGCRGLDYGPQLFLRLKGGMTRGAHPKLRAVLVAKPGEEANTARASVALPRSEFLENAHIQTVCTRVQFAADQCSAGSVYGQAIAFTPLLDEPLTGPVYLRSSSHELPDMVVALHGPPSRPIKVELDGRIDSVRGGIRSTFEMVPDQPVSKFILNMQGGRKGLIVNSRNLCTHTYRAVAQFDGQNGKADDSKPKVRAASCAKARHGRHKRGR